MYKANKSFWDEPRLKKNNNNKMKKEEFTKNFKYTLRAKNGRIMAQSIIEFGSEEKPFPKDWKENAMVQSSLFDFKEEFLKSSINFIK